MNSSSDYLAEYQELIDYSAIQEQRRFKAKKRQQAIFDKYRHASQELAEFHTNHVVCDQDQVQIGLSEELDEAQQAKLLAALKVFIPWRKGPFNIFGNVIDSEWQSHWKWNRILPHIKPLRGKRVMDIGCNNGYYLFRMTAENPALVMGVDPTVSFRYAFEALQQMAQVPKVHFEPLGGEHMSWFPKFFDTVFCLGILYHHPDPVGMLKQIHQSLKVGGQLVVECAGIPGDDSVALFPKKRYAGMSGAWFFPTKSCLIHWLERAGFREVSLFHEHPLSPEEQRNTPWAPFDSLEQFLDPDDSQSTVEGYPAPQRFYVTATRTF